MKMKWGGPAVPPSGSRYAGPCRRRVRRATAFLLSLFLCGAGFAAASGETPPATAPRPLRIAEANDPVIIAKAAALGNDPAQIFAFVRDQIGFDVYRGALRGARGTLWSRAGNSLDRADLLVSLLRASGFTARYVQGTLPDNLVQQVILRMFPNHIRILGCNTAGAVSEPGGDPSLYVDGRPHFWAEFSSGGPFTAMDPSFPASTIGSTFAASTGNFDEIPDALRHTVRIRVNAEIFSTAGGIFGFGPSTVTRLDQTFRTAELVDRPISVGHLASTATAGAAPFTVTTHTYTPYLLVGQSDADASDDPIHPGTDYQETLTNFPLGSQVLTGVFLVIDVIDSQGQTRSFERTLLDRIGFAARVNGGSVSVSPSTQQAPAFTPMDLATIGVVPGLQSLEFFDEQLARLQALQTQLAILEPQVAALPAAPPLTPAQNTVLQKSIHFNRLAAIATNELAVSAFAGASDRSLRQLEQTYLTRAYYTSPRLTIALSRVEGNVFDVRLDIRKNDLRAIPAPGQRVKAQAQFETARGYLDSTIEGTILSAILGRPALSVTDILAAVPDPRDLVLVTPQSSRLLESLAISDTAKARIQAALTAGRVVWTPRTMVPVGGTPVIGWFETDPVTGYTISTMEDGGHQGAFVEYAFIYLETQFGVNSLTARFIGNMNGFAVSSIAFTGALVGGLASGQEFAGAVAAGKLAVVDLMENTLLDFVKFLEDTQLSLALHGSDVGTLVNLIAGLREGIENALTILVYSQPTDPPLPTILTSSLAPAPPTVPPGGSPAVSIDVVPDPLFTVPFGGAQVPSVFIARIQNLGPAEDTFQLTFGPAPLGFLLRSAVPSVRIPAGHTAEIGVCLVPFAPLGTAGTPAPFTTTASSIAAPAVTDNEIEPFSIPSVEAVAVDFNPSSRTALPGESFGATVALANVGNVPTTAALSLSKTPGLAGTGLTTPIPLPVGALEHQNLSLQVSPGATPGQTLQAGVSADFGSPAMRSKASLSVAVTSAGDRCPADGAIAAEAIGRTGLATKLHQVGLDVSALRADPGSALLRSRLLGNLSNLVAQMNATFLSAFPAPLAASGSAIAAASPGAIPALLDTLAGHLCNLKAALEAARTDDFSIALDPNSAVNLPGSSTTFRVFVLNSSPNRRSFQISLAGIPAGVTASLNVSQVTLAPNESSSGCCGAPALQVTIDAPPDDLTAFDFTVTASPLDSPHFSHTAAGRMTVRDEVIEILEVRATPGFVDPGGTVTPSVRLLNAVNQTRTVHAHLRIRNALNAVVRDVGIAGTANLTVGAGISTLNLTAQNTTGLAAGLHTFEVTLLNTSFLPIPGGVASGPFLIGAPFSARLSVAPEIVLPGDATVTTTLTLDRDAIPTPTATLRGHVETPGGASSAALNGSLAYVCGTTEGSVVDVSDPENPQIVGSFGAAQLAGGYQTVGCTIFNGHLLVLFDDPDPARQMGLAVFNLSNPLAPSLVSSETFNKKIGGAPFSFIGNFGLTFTNIYLFNVFSGFIFEQHGDLLSFDLSNLSEPALAGNLFSSGHAVYGGDNLIFGHALANAQTGLLATTTSTGGAPETGEGRLLPVNLASPGAPTALPAVAVPGTRLLTGLAVQGGRALAAGDTLGFFDGRSGLTGKLTLSAFDLTAPAAPTLTSTLITTLSDREGGTLIPLGGNLFALGASKSTGGQSVLALVDASNPAALRVVPYDVAAVTQPQAAVGNLVYAVSELGLSIYEIGSVTGPQVTARVSVPKNTGVTLVPGSFNLAPTQILPGPDFDTFEWEQPSISTITWQVQVTDVEPGLPREVALGGEVDFTVAALGSGQIDFGPVSITSDLILSLSPESRSVAIGEPGDYTLTLKNPTASPVTYALSVSGVPPGWIKQLSPSVLVPPMSETTTPLILQSSMADPLATFLFQVTATSPGFSGSVLGRLINFNFRSVGTNRSPLTFSASLALLPVSTTAGRGVPARLTARMTNTGTGADQYTLVPVSLPGGWTIGFSPNNVPVAPVPDGFRDVFVTITPPAGAAPGGYDIPINLHSFQTSGVLDSETAHVDVAANAVSVALSPPAGPPSTTFQMTITNTGTVADVFDLGLGGLLGPLGFLGSPSVSLAPGGSQMVPITFEPITSAPPGPAPFEAYATSRGNAAIFGRAVASVTVPARKGVAASFSPPATYVSSIPGTSDFSFQVRNTGNVEDTFQAAILGTAGPVTGAALLPLTGAPVQAIGPLRIPPGGVAQIPATATLTALPEGTVTGRALSLTDGSVSAQAIETIGVGGGFYSVTPCRIVDTRDPPGAYGDPPLVSGLPRIFVIGGQCGIPATARAVAFNFTITAPDVFGHLTIYPDGTAKPVVSTMNFRTGQTRANNAIIPLGPGGTIAVVSGQPAGGTVHFIVDVTGYFD